MTIVFSKTFTKAYKKLDLQIKTAFTKKLSLFRKNEFDTRLRNHTLYHPQ